MEELFTGMMTKFNASTSDSFYVSVGGRLYNTFAPQPTVYPYAVFFLVSDVPEFRFGQEIQDDIVLQFNLFSDDNDGVEINNMHQYLKTFWDDSTFTITGFNNLYFIRTNGFLLRDEERSVWQYAVEYEVMIEQ